ncbi:MAG TPA: hypothetical protein VK980_15910 [Sphingomonas sp.]|nr:hypothetical protein [Sphingomonas sp.]
MAHSPYPGDGVMLVAALFFVVFAMRSISAAVRTRKYGDGWKANAPHFTMGFFLAGCALFLVAIHRLGLAS